MPSMLFILRRNFTVICDKTVVLFWLHGRCTPYPSQDLLVQFMCGKSFSVEALIIPTRQNRAAKLF